MAEPQDDAAIQRLAVIGDVHAEDRLLAVALEAISKLTVDAVACTGDIADGYGDVNRCCELLQHHRVLCVRGNHDRWLFTGLLRTHKKATALDGVRADHQRFLRELLPTREFPIAGGRLLLCHGIGFSDLEKICAWDTDHTLGRNEALRRVCENPAYRVMVNGHSHQRLVRRVRDLTIVNAGTLCEDDPGFVVLDIPANLLQWHALDGQAATVIDERDLFQ